MGSFCTPLKRGWQCMGTVLISDTLTRAHVRGECQSSMVSKTWPCCAAIKKDFCATYKNTYGRGLCLTPPPAINLYLGLKPSLSNEATQVQNRSEMHHNRNNTEDCHDSLYCMTCISNPFVNSTRAGRRSYPVHAINIKTRTGEDFV